MSTIVLNLFLISLFSWNTYNCLQLSKGQYPSLVSIFYRGQHQCGGVFVSNSHVLSSAHCVYHLSKTTYIFSGVVHTGETWTNGHTINKIIIHPSFDSCTRDYDIALIKLTTPITYKPLYAGFIEIIDADYELKVGGQLVTIVSWEPDKKNLQLTSTTAELLKPSLCSPPGILSDIDHTTDKDKICAEPFHGACVEDDAAALLYNDTILWGIGSLNENCYNKEKPIVFMNLAKFRNWIDSIRFS